MIMCADGGRTGCGTYALSTADKTVASERVSGLGNHESRHTTYRSCWRRYRRTCQSACSRSPGAIRDIEPTAQVTVIGTAVGLEGFGAGVATSSTPSKSAVPASP